jgi:ER membrane protein complex subunit 1
LDVVARGDSVAARAMITAQDGSIHLLRNNEHSWTREESLAHTIPEHTLFLDLPVPEPKVHLKVTTGNLFSAYINRVSTHIKQLRDLPSGLKTFARHFATGRYEEIEIESTNRDAFGLRKFITVATETGKLVALDSANRGNVVWSQFIGEGTEIYGMWILRESSAVRGQPPLIGVLLEIDGNTEFWQVNGLDGAIFQKEPAHIEFPNIAKAFSVPLGVTDEQGHRAVIVIPSKGAAKVFPGEGNVNSVLSTLSDKLYYSVQGASAIQGYFFDSEVCSLHFLNNFRLLKACQHGGLRSQREAICF